MNQKECNELRRRLRPDKSAISRIYGCFVNSSREIVSDLDEPLGLMPQEEAEKYLGLLKKTLSGTLGKNLLDVVFSTQQVADSEEHRLLTALRECELRDGGLRRTLYEQIIRHLDLGDLGYLILLAHDAYDVPRRAKDDAPLADSEEVYSYLVCCVCPVKPTRPQLGYFPGENEFHCSAGQTVAMPEVGFLFPAFDNRAANLYNALYYIRKEDELHQELVEGLFHVQPPLSPTQQREAFGAALDQTLGEYCCVQVLQGLHQQLLGRLEEHKTSRDPEAPAITAGELQGILLDCGVPQEQAAAFREAMSEKFGPDAAVNPANLVGGGRLEIKTDQAAVTLAGESACWVDTRVIDGRPYLLIPVPETVEVNGLPVASVTGLGQGPAAAE